MPEASGAIGLRKSPWVNRLAAAVEVLLGIYVVLMVTDKLKEFADGVAVAAALGSIVLASIHPLPRERARWCWLFAGCLAIFLAINLLSALLAVDLPNRGSFHWRRMHITDVLVALSAGLGLRKENGVRRMLGWLLVLAGLWYLGETVSLIWRSPYSILYEDARLKGARGYPTRLASELVVLSALYLGWFFVARSRIGRWGALGLAALTLALLLLTKGRGALLALAFGAIPSVCIFQKRLGSLRQRLAAAGLWVFLLAPMAILLWCSQASDERRSGATICSRLAIYRICLQVAGEAPWPRTVMGHGASSRGFPAIAEYYGTDSPIIMGERSSHAHNVPLQVFLETGAVGLAALAAVWLTAFRSAWLAWRSAEKDRAGMAGALLVVLVTMAIAGQSNYTLWGVAGQLHWFLAGLAFAVGVAQPAAESRPGGSREPAPGTAEPGSRSQTAMGAAE